MKKLAGLLALAVLLSFGTATVTFAGDPAPAPTEKKDKGTKKPKFFGSGKKKDEKKGDKGGK